MLQSILTFLFPKTIASIKKDALDKYFADDMQQQWDEINEYEERMHLENEQLDQSYMDDL
jgi:hypothetical protein